MKLSYLINPNPSIKRDALKRAPYVKRWAYQEFYDFEKNKIITILPLVLLITGCVTSYVEPASGPMARVTFINSTNAYMWLNSYANEKKCTGSQVIGMFNSGANVALKVKAGIPATFSLGYILLGSPYNYTCTLMPTFTPKENESYLVKIQLDSEEKTCSLSMFRVLGDNQLDKVNDVVMRKYKKPFVDSQGFCEEVSK